MELPVLIVFIIIFGSNVQDVVLERDCEAVDCVSCVRQHKNCRWCYEDSKCYPYRSLGNPCSKSDRIVDVDGCKKVIYDANLAYKMVLLSALAYADVVANYIQKASEVNTFGLVKQITKSCSGNAQCSGFVAVSHTEKAIAIAFRGSEHIEQVSNQILKVLSEPKVSFPAAGIGSGKVQGYFYEAFYLIWNKLKGEVYKQIKAHQFYKVWVTGHSLGAALASLASTTLVYEGMVAKNNLVFYSFGQPRVGNHDYALTHDTNVPISYRVTHYRDVVVHLPTCNKAGPFCSVFGGGPYHHGKEIYYDKEVMSKSSSYKECTGLPTNEDKACSNSFMSWTQCFLPSEIKKCIKDHVMYFGLSVGTWWHDK